MTPTTALLQDPAFWAAVLTISTPLVFGVMGALLCARAGELNFGIAGVFLIGALMGLVLPQNGVDPWMALLAAAGAGMIVGLLQGILTGPLGISQPLAGIALTLLGIGIAHAGWPSTPTPAAAFHPFDVPFLSGLPYVGEALARQTPLDLLAVLTALVIAYVLNRTPLGLAIRACGDNPFAVEVQGRSVHGLRIGGDHGGLGDHGARRGGDCADGIRSGRHRPRERPRISLPRVGRGRRLAARSCLRGGIVGRRA